MKVHTKLKSFNWIALKEMLLAPPYSLFCEGKQVEKLALHPSGGGRRLAPPTGLQGQLHEPTDDPVQFCGDILVS